MNPTTEMSHLLASSGVRLSDPNAITQALLNARFTSREIMDHMADAVETARALRVGRSMQCLLGRFAL